MLYVSSFNDLKASLKKKCFTFHLTLFDTQIITEKCITVFKTYQLQKMLLFFLCQNIILFSDILLDRINILCNIIYYFHSRKYILN